MRHKVLFVSHDMNPTGGGSLVTCWALQARESAYDVTAITWERPDYAVLDRTFGTSLAGARFETVTPCAVERWAVNAIPDNSLHQRANYLLRMAKRRAHAFAVSVASGFESDLGRRGIQYVNYPYISQRSQRWTVAGDAPLAARMRAVLGGRLPLWMLISGYSFERMRGNLTLANSNWSRNVLDAAGMPCEVLYPPAPGDFADTPWANARTPSRASRGWFRRSARTGSPIRSRWCGGNGRRSNCTFADRRRTHASSSGSSEWRGRTAPGCAFTATCRERT